MSRMIERRYKRERVVTGESTTIVNTVREIAVDPLSVPPPEPSGVHV